MKNRENENGFTCNQTDKCPEERILELFVERELEEDLAERIAIHISECKACKDIVREHSKWLLDGRKLDVNDATEEQRSAVREILNAAGIKRAQKIWREIFDAFKERTAYLAAADGQTGDQIQQETAMRSGFVHFVSDSSQNRLDAWHAKLAFPAAITDETYIRLQIFDGEEQPIESGTLIFCGVELNISEGYAYMSVKDFREHIGSSIIALKRSDGKVIPGEPVRAYGAEGHI